MIELNFSLIGTETPTLRKMLDKFEEEYKVHVRVRSIDWEGAWYELLSWALHSQGPDVSHIGSTWSASLIAMNALRPFSNGEIRLFGGSQAFLPQAWQSGTLIEQPDVWSIPWTTYTFVLCYRRDLLDRAGVIEKAAFTSPTAVEGTLANLRGAGIEMPWIVPVAPNHIDTLHHLASFVWGMGGDFVSPAGLRMTFTQPMAMAGFKAYFDLLRYQPPAFFPLDDNQAEQYFTRGQAGVTIVGADRPYAWIRQKSAAPEVLDNLGVIPMPGVPWIGGDNLVIWKEARVSIERERAAVELIKFLTSRQSQEAYCRGEEINLPIRPDVFDLLPLPGTPITKAAIESLTMGRAYRPLGMWSKIEHQFGQTLGQVAADVLSGVTPSTALHNHLELLDRRLQVTLGK
jgi:ABC-type glycerol-3-phosphate transport system substrate-binding protein